MLIFQYGSNLSTARLNGPERLGGGARVIGVAHTVTNFEFGFPVWGGINGCAAAGILPGGARPVWGVVYEIPDALVTHGGRSDGPSLDEIEDEGRDYRRGPIDLRMVDGSAPGAPVQTYHPHRPRTGLRTEWHYVRHILAGAHEHALPGDYQAWLRERILANNPALAAPLSQFAPDSSPLANSPLGAPD
jgi:hypothetical protein